MYSQANSPVLGSSSLINDHHTLTTLTSPGGGHLHPAPQTSSQCLRFKYFTTFLICTTCLALLSASLATHKWIVSKPTRVLKLNGAHQTNFTALMLVAAQDDQHQSISRRYSTPHSSSLTSSQQASSFPHWQANTDSLLSSISSSSSSSTSPSQTNNNKFQGEIYFGLFSGVKVLNYGFGDRVSQISVVQPYLAKEQPPNHQAPQHELIDFKFWLATLMGVGLAILFALIGSIFAIINFVMTPRGTLTGPVGLVIWNAAACFSCLLAMVAWLVEYFIRLKANVLSPEEVQNGWSSENRSQFGYSFYLIVLAFVLHLVNIFIVSIVQFETWNSHKAAKRQSRAVCEGVIMLY